MYCRFCGKKIEDDSRYCKCCGTALFIKETNTEDLDCIDDECEDEEEFEEEDFILDDDDYYAIDLAKKAALIAIKNYELEPLEINELQKVINALERLPEITEDLHVEFGVSYESKSEHLYERISIYFIITDSYFEISPGGYIDSVTGGDSYSEPGYYLEFGSFKNCDCDLCILEDELNELFSLGAKITVEDFS